MFELVIAFIAGWMFGTYQTAKNIRKILSKEIELEVTNSGKQDVKVFSIENHKNILYLYDVETGTFVCQGKTIEELAENSFKYKNVDIAVASDSVNVFKFKEGKVL
jgi:hypothetical protein